MTKGKQIKRSFRTWNINEFKPKRQAKDIADIRLCDIAEDETENVDVLFYD